MTIKKVKYFFNVGIFKFNPMDILIIWEEDTEHYLFGSTKYPRLRVQKVSKYFLNKYI